MIKAVIQYTLDNIKLLNTLNKALKPDNEKTPPYMSINSKVHDNMLSISIIIEGYEEKIGTLLNTLDEILALMKSIEKSISEVMREKYI
ncbi:MAG TPA: hypothetical protein EYH40_00360 [Desulfurococcales archaeon]|nr:hypothetical protein [Desulfurococcales archaeon]